MIPEFRFGNDFVTSEESDCIYFGASFLFSGELAAKNEILSHLRIIDGYTFIWREGSVGS
jgi:hypothetical protein